MEDQYQMTSDEQQSVRLKARIEAEVRLLYDLMCDLQRIDPSNFSSEKKTHYGQTIIVSATMKQKASVKNTPKRRRGRPRSAEKETTE